MSKIYEHTFGPGTMEAIASAICDEINPIRVKLDLPDRTVKQIKTAIEEKYDSLVLGLS